MAGDKIICHCKQVSYIDIRKAMIAGARTVQEIKDMTGAATGCGRCVGEIENILASVCGCKGVSLEDVGDGLRDEPVLCRRAAAGTAGEQGQHQHPRKGEGKELFQFHGRILRSLWCF